MGSGMPEIGSRISLISKADIRYEGKLFAVDPDECTIALSSVRSYGTEDRKTTYPVPAQNQVYDFILFRGSDIKDIRVLTTTIPNDPAIVQLSVPPSLSGAVESQFEVVEGEFRVPGVAGGSRMPNAPGASSRPTQTFQNSGFKSTSGFSNIEQVMNKHPVQNAVSEDESRSSTPSAQNAKSSDAQARTSISSTKSDEHLQSEQQRKQLTYGNRDMSRSQPHQQQNNRYQQGGKQQYQQRYQQNRYPQQQQQNQYQRYQQQSQYRDYNNRDGQYNNRDNQYNNRENQYNNRENQYNNRDQYNNRENQYRNYNNEYREDYGQRHYMQPLRGNVQRTDNWTNYGQRRMNLRPGQGIGNQQNNYQSAGGYQNNQNRRPRNTLKFDDDYDFEQANSQFEEMRTQLAKTKIDETESPKMNGDVVVDVSKKEDSGNEVSGGEENDQDGSEKAQCYDKVKSFFDQISYESIERSKGLTARMDWKTERKINSETFGQVALRRNGNFRRRVNNGGGGGGNGYYNYSNNRNAGMQNNYRTGGYNNRTQGKPRRQFNNPTSNQEESKENEVVA